MAAPDQAPPLGGRRGVGLLQPRSSVVEHRQVGLEVPETQVVNESAEHRETKMSMEERVWRRTPLRSFKRAQRPDSRPRRKDFGNGNNRRNPLR